MSREHHAIPDATFPTQLQTTDYTNIMPNTAELEAEIARLRGKLEKKNKLPLKVSEKGGVSLYGLGRFPVTLYKEQWIRILASAPEIEAFIRENDSKLKTKE